VRFPRTRTLLQSAVADRATPAVVIEVGSADRAVWTDAFGALTYDADAPRATPDTIFDLASLTKVIATAALTMRHFTSGMMHGGMRVGEIFPDWDTDPAHAAITVRHLLDHSSGLAAHGRFWEQHRGRRAFAEAIRRTALERAPGDAAVYSDLGFMMLGFLIEYAGHRSLDEQFAMLGFSENDDLEFLPPRDLAARIAPTEFDAWRGRLLVGEVHDENAAALDGVAGHAGLFGTAPAVGRFARLVLRTFTEKSELGTPELMRTFATTTGVPGSSRALAWDTMRPTSSCGARASASAIGHTGFTGTSLWIEPDKDRYVVLLSNRVHPTRENQKFKALRAAIHDAVDEDLETNS
jgi:CubicO group peptidase (beta-lactamase class C family)